MEYFWTYEDWNGERFDAEFKTEAEADAHAQEKFAAECEDRDDVRNGDIFDEEILLIKFHYDENGDAVDDETKPGVVEYEYYHGDYAEHFRQSDYI